MSKNRASLRALRLVAWAVLVLALLPLRTLASPAYAEDIDPNDVCWLDSGVCPETFPPPALLGKDAYAAMTPAQASALHTLETQALNNTMTAHNLPANQLQAVQAWDRPEAQAELFALVVEGIKTPAAERSPEQQQAAEWMAGLAREETKSAANHAGAQYAAWAGQDLNDYWQLIRDDAGPNRLANFLSVPPQPYDNPVVSQAKSGYCTFKPPAPYGDEYSARDAQTCYTPCTDSYLCTPPSPDYEQFVKWGEAAAIQGVIDSPEYFVNAGQIVLGMAATAAAVAAAPVWLSVMGMGTIHITTTIGLALAQALFTADSIVVFTAAADSFIYLIPAAGFAVAAIASSVLVVIAAIVTAVLEGIRVGDTLKLPGKLADLIVGARADVDIAAFAATDAGAQTMFSVFVRATLPLPRADLRCDNSDPQIPVPCLNQPPLPPTEATDPAFVVRADVDGAHDVVSPTITLPGPEPTVRKVRIHGDWFVQRLSSDAKSETPTLSLGYTDWDGKAQRARLVRDPEGHYTFLGLATASASTLDIKTCKAEGTCWTSDSIKYLGPDGQRYSARIEVPAAPTGTPTYSPLQPAEGQLMTFRANGFAPAGAVGTVSYAWQFQKAGCGVPCTVVVNTGTGVTTEPAFSEKFTGASKQYQWPTSGTFAVRLTAKDYQGRVAVKDFKVSVTAVAPTITLDVETAFGIRFGATASMGGVIDFAGKMDNLTVTANWGDGSPADVSNYGPNVVPFLTDALSLESIPVYGGGRLRFAARHTYQSGGFYIVKITVTNQAGQSATGKFRAVVDLPL